MSSVNPSSNNNDGLFAEFKNASEMSSDELKKAASEFYWYHSIDLGKGVRTVGDYDMERYLPRYHFPDQMDGLKVLDVGRASGFFAFEFEKHGADVTATEIKSYFDWDFVGGEREKARKFSEIQDPENFTRTQITGAFWFAHGALNSKVKSVEGSVYEISPATAGGPFDIIFAGSITSHLRDPILALEKLSTVLAPDGVCIVSAPYIGLDEKHPLAAMVGTSDSDRRSWWVVNKKCLCEMLKAAGFKSVEIVDDFLLELDRPGGEKGTFPHIVAHARLL